MEDFDHAWYRESLGFLAKTAYDEYRHVCWELPRHQASMLRTYLWLASLVATFQIGFYFKVIAGSIEWHGQTLTVDIWFYLAGGLAIAAALAAFTLGVDTLRGRGMAALPLGDFNTLADDAYTMAFTPGSCSVYPSMIHALNGEIMRQTALASRKGKKLRAMSWLILCSVFFSLLAAGRVIATSL